MYCSSPAAAGFGQRAAWAAGVALLALTAQGAPPKLLTHWVVSSFQPNIPNGGRADTIAVHPQTDNIILVTSSTGGLFRSTDRGEHWKHVETLAAYGNAVAFWPNDPNVVIATARADFHVENYGGIWRSANGGGSWNQIPIAGVPAGGPAVSAGEISIAPDTGAIYVATNYGLAVSTDGGKSFTNQTPFGSGLGAAEVLSVLALPGNVVLAGGKQGISRSVAGSAWQPPANSPGAVTDMHAFGRSALAVNQAYVVNEGTELYVTENGGQSWQQISSAPKLPPSSAAGGIGFVRTARAPAQPNQGAALDLYYSNRYGLIRLRCPPIAGTSQFNYSGAWTTLGVDHPDIRDIAFDSSQQPLLVASDGGLHTSADGGSNWNLTGGGNNGFNALQITEVRGQWIEDVARFDLYFGTQDNGFWTSQDLGQTWKVWGNEGAGIEVWRRVPNAAASVVTLDDTGAAAVFFGGPDFANMQPWKIPPERMRYSLAEAPKLIGAATYIQAVNESTIMLPHPHLPPHPVKNFGKGYVITSNQGVRWDQYVEFPEDPRDLPKLSFNGGNPPQAVLYQAIRSGWLWQWSNIELNQLARITAHSSGNWGKVEYPAMKDFGGLGFNSTMFAWYQVFAVDPLNPNYLIAPDVVNEKMMISSDGGNNWKENAQLTALVTDNGTFQFKVYGNIPHASVVSFCPEDPDLVAVGTWQAGILVSADHGATWSKVPDSDLMTRITAIEWRNAGEMIVSTYGRGLWRVVWTMVGPKQPFPKYCVGCKVGPPVSRLKDPGQPVERVAFTQAILVLEGRLQGFRAAAESALEVFVWPGSSVSILTDQRAPSRVKVTETKQWMGLGDARREEPEPTAKDLRLVGLLTGSRGEVTHAVFSQQPLTARQMARRTLPAGRSVSPTRGRPYLRLGAGGGQNVFVPGEEMALKGTGFPAGAALEILLDGVVETKAAAGKDGVVSATLRAPRQQGVHNVTARRPGGERPLDGASLLVKSRDGR